MTVGAAIGISIGRSSEWSQVGIFLIIMAGILFLVGKDDLEKRIKITSSINRDPALVRYAIRATRNQAIQREMDHLIAELSKGNLQAGLGEPGHVEGTNICYLRGKKGARLFYRVMEYGYDLVGKADGTGKKLNEHLVIEHLKEVYSR